ncbi:MULTISPECIES: TMEM175 family protein [unclassified Streptomyces]|uniref:TMEM175 family protein n=1 Tax=unclassified Streptomyces TaxID=2593676 RepID=UPI00364A5012
MSGGGRVVHRDGQPDIGAFALSFTLIAGFWRDHRRILTALPTETTMVTRLTLIDLGLVALLPFPTAPLAEYASQPETVALCAGAMATIHAVFGLSIPLAFVNTEAAMWFPVSCRLAGSPSRSGQACPDYSLPFYRYGPRRAPSAWRRPTSRRLGPVRSGRGWEPTRSRSRT